MALLMASWNSIIQWNSGMALQNGIMKLHYEMTQWNGMAMWKKKQEMVSSVGLFWDLVFIFLRGVECVRENVFVLCFNFLLRALRSVLNITGVEPNLLILSRPIAWRVGYIHTSCSLSLQGQNHGRTVKQQPWLILDPGFLSIGIFGTCCILDCSCTAGDPIGVWKR